MSVVVLLADGARADSFGAACDSGELPALGRLKREGALHTVTTVFPSVTGLAYVPFLMGRFPGPVGLPGLRWYDRARSRCRLPPFCRSYLSAEMRHLDGDLDARAPMIFDLVRSRFNAMSMVGRGVKRADRLGRSFGFMMRVARVHWRADIRGWLDIDRFAGRHVARHLRAHRPDFTFLALLGLDKTSHASGHDSAPAREALRIVDDVAAEIRHDAERDGRWDDMHLWVVSDHGHSPVQAHDDIAHVIHDAGYRTISHPWVYALRRPDVAVMVSGNAMAHLYLETWRRTRPWWPELASRWETLAEMLLERESVDLLLLPLSPTRCEVRGRGRGCAIIEFDAGRISYTPMTGDPLGLGEQRALDADESHEVSMHSCYPDALAQIAHLAGSARAGEIILSAAPGWDFRAKYEPIPHVSTHGALHREHMLVPLLVNRPVLRAPRRTTDVMPSALSALGVPVPRGLD
ncbi:MAG TPA: alkaline phosphatase family protein, partial [Gemmatimonadaceae bacterium]|nr:alkaline phosphatase family protein [Gemmatimonadaceae bacterium]